VHVVFTSVMSKAVSQSRFVDSKLRTFLNHRVVLNVSFVMLE